MIVQSMTIDSFLVPKRPPRSMLMVDNQAMVTNDWALEGRPAMDFVQKRNSASYDAFRRQWSTSVHVIEVRLSTGIRN